MSGSKEVSLQEVAVAEHGQKPAAHAPPAAQKPGASGEYTCAPPVPSPRNSTWEP